jgi:hypothetical protein
MAIQEVEGVTELYAIPTALHGAEDNRTHLFRSGCASTMDLTAQHPSVEEIHDFSFLLYLAQTCHMITQGGYFLENIRGSGQILHDDPVAMWNAAGCEEIYPGFNASASDCEMKEGVVVGSAVIAQAVVPTLEECVTQCAESSACRAYSYGVTNCSTHPGCGERDHICYIRADRNGEKPQAGRVSGACTKTSEAAGVAASLSEFEVPWRGRCGST